MKPLFRPVPVEVFAGGVAQLPSPWAHALHKPCFIVFLAGFAAAWVGLLLGVEASGEWRWLEGALWPLAAATSIVGLARRLPEQSVFVAVTLIIVISLCILSVAERTGVPFGPRAYTDALGLRLFGVPWAIPFLWLAIIVCSRGVARLIMRPWRKTTYYGFWVIGLACLLIVFFDTGLEPFATRVKHYWFWEVRGKVPGWYSAPWVNFLGWFAAAVGILAFTTPWLINKQPVKQPTDYHPLVVWLLLNFYFATGCALQQLWPAVGFSILGNAIVTVYAVRGARW
jgi:uncharacterized membrane protein